MPKAGQYKDIKGKKFWKLTAIEFINILPGRRTMWKVECECGNITEASYKAFRAGNKKSCGCSIFDKSRERLTKHVLSRTSPIYLRWKLIKGRCLNQKDKRYKDYRRRGITLWEEW